MNKWEDSFKKTSDCACTSNQGLFVPNRQLSFIVAGFIFIMFFTFMSGYFLGKKKMAEQFVQEVGQDAVGDKIYTAMLSIPQDAAQLENNDLLVTHEQVQHNEFQEKIVLRNDSGIEQDNSVLPENNQRYYAQLIGFGTEKAAQLFVKKLSKKGIETEVKKRISKTVKGSTSYWYQVITTVYSNKTELSELVERLTKEENIKDACIRIC